MKKSEANQIAKRQVDEWLTRNRDPGVLPSIPIILISSLCGEKAGITINLNHQMPLKDVITILQCAREQVENTLKRLEQNGENGETKAPTGLS